MDISVLRDEKSRLEREIARLLKQFEDDVSAEILKVDVSPGQNHELIDNNSISVKGERWFRVKIVIEV